MNNVELVSIGTYKSDEACQAITDCAEMIKDCFQLEPLIDRLAAKTIINDEERREVTDDSCGLTKAKRMDKLLNIVKASIRLNGEDFGSFIEAIKQEKTKRGDSVAKKLKERYYELCATGN